VVPAQKSSPWVGEAPPPLECPRGRTGNDGFAPALLHVDGISTDSVPAAPAIAYRELLYPGTTWSTISQELRLCRTRAGLAAAAPSPIGNPFHYVHQAKGATASASLGSVQNGTLVFGNTGQNTFKKRITLSGSGAMVFAGNNTQHRCTPDGSTALTIQAGQLFTISNNGATFPTPIHWMEQ